MATVRQLLDEKGHNVITVGADDTVFDAVRKMAEENIGSLIVCEGSKNHWHYNRTTLRSECVFGRPRITEHTRGGRYGDPSLVRPTRSNCGRMHGGDDREASSPSSRH